MTNYQYLIRFLKEYVLFKKTNIINHVKLNKSHLSDYSRLFNFINTNSAWEDTKEGRLFWEQMHYYCMKYFYDIHPNKKEAKIILKNYCYYYLNGGLLTDVKHTQIWQEITEFKKLIFEKKLGFLLNHQPKKNIHIMRIYYSNTPTIDKTFVLIYTKSKDYFWLGKKTLSSSTVVKYTGYFNFKGKNELEKIHFELPYTMKRDHLMIFYISEKDYNFILNKIKTFDDSLKLLVYLEEEPK